jgi:hypothetical protein
MSGRDEKFMYNEVTEDYLNDLAALKKSNIIVDFKTQGFEDLGWMHVVLRLSLS